MQLLLTLFFYWLIFIPNPTPEFSENNGNGNRIAIHIDSGSDLPTTEQFQFARSIGVDLIEIADPERLSSDILQNFFILLSSENKYVTLSEISSNRDRLIDRTENSYRNLPAPIRDRVAAVSLFKFPADYTERFMRELSLAADSLSQSLNKPIYYQSAFSQPSSYPQSLGFTSVFYNARYSPAALTSPVIYFNPTTEDHRLSVQHLEELMNSLLRHDTSIIIMSSDWFFNTLENQPDLATLVSVHLNGQYVDLPLPAETLSEMSANWHIILLFAMFAVLAIHYKYQPFFLSFAARYYLNHSFFVADLFEGRVRSRSSGLVIIGLHALATGLLLYVLSGFLISPNGFSALEYYLPHLFLSDFAQYTFFIAGFLLATLSHFISIFWIFILNKKITQLAQAMHLYCWPLLTNIVIVAFLVAFIEIGYGMAVIVLLSALFFLVWFLSFNIAAIQGGRQLDGNPFWNLTFTVGLHSILLLATVLSILFTPWLTEPVQLIVSLP
ncbi:MAG: hypothetical protein JJU37_12690 [Balneolaceae bacterium]|nr:hypothetical protein [Balneolaceae bacterium]